MMSLAYAPFLRPAIALLAAFPLVAGEGVRIDSIQPGPNGVVLEWFPGTGDDRYLVQRRATWGEDLWLTPRGATPWPQTATTWLDTQARQDPAAFYRVVSVPPIPRGQIVSSVPTQRIPKGDVQALLALMGVPMVPGFDVQVVKVIYPTPDAHGLRNDASGLILLPVGASNSVPMMTYQHGTLIQKSDAPSVSTTSLEFLVGVVFASTGYIAVLPDYLGLGDSAGFHPYHHAASEATAAVDLLRAAREYSVEAQIAWNRQLFVCGYSQGGHAAAALHRELEEYHADEFTITASALMAGAYDLSGVTADDLLSDRAQPNPYYFAYLLAAYQEVYRFAPGLAEILSAPYDTTLPPLLDGKTGSSAINAAMPAQPWKTLKPEVLAAFKTNPRHPLRLALAENDLIHWTPRAPTRLYHCSGDLDVPPLNSRVARDQFVSRGANVELIDPQPGADHGDCALPALLAAKQWFDSLKQ
ncbi:MAG: alpha/beta hydrolase family protein [Limisphaerales bacterium]